MKSKIITGILFFVIIVNVYLLQADLITLNANGGAQFLSIQDVGLRVKEKGYIFFVTFVFLVVTFLFAQESWT